MMLSITLLVFLVCLHVPPTEPQELIFVSHLPVITQMLRAWSKLFHQDEPALVELGSGYLIDPSTQTISPIHPR
jgi:hypothetical protein